jgi:hypothetical protein
MKFDYEYKIQLIDYKGLGTVEYTVPLLGKITRVFFIPWSMGVNVVDRICREKFPMEMFFSRWQAANSKSAPDEIRNLQGKGSISYEDYYYDFVVELADTKVIDNEKKSD